MVFLTRRYAFKVPSFVEWRLFLCGLLGNMQEAQFGRTGWPELAPVTFRVPGGFLTVMRRAEPLTREQWDNFDPEGFCDAEDYQVPAEHKMDSFGILDGRYVAVDYGSA